jgi:hypothetical protein
MLSFSSRLQFFSFARTQRRTRRQIKPINLKKAGTFSGMGKGFFQRAASSGGKSGVGGGEEEDEIEEISPKKPGERPGELAEVQAAMAAAAPFLEARKDEWCTPSLLEKLEKVGAVCVCVCVRARAFVCV